MNELLYLRMAERLMANFAQSGGIKGITSLVEGETSELVEILERGPLGLGGVMHITREQARRMTLNRLIIDTYCMEKGYGDIETYALFQLNDNHIAYGQPDAREGIEIPPELRDGLVLLLKDEKDLLAAGIRLADDIEFRTQMVKRYNEETLKVIREFTQFWSSFIGLSSPKS